MPKPLVYFALIYLLVAGFFWFDQRRIENPLPIAQYKAIQAVIDAETGQSKTATTMGSVIK